MVLIPFAYPFLHSAYLSWPPPLRSHLHIHFHTLPSSPLPTWLRAKMQAAECHGGVDWWGWGCGEDGVGGELKI